MAIRAIRAFGEFGAAGAQQYECSHNIILCAQYPVIHTIYNYIISVCVCEPQAWTDPGHPVLQACQPNYHQAHDHPLDGEEHHQNFKIYNSGPRGFLGLFLMLIK